MSHPGSGNFKGVKDHKELVSPGEAIDGGTVSDAVKSSRTEGVMEIYWNLAQVAWSESLKKA